MPAPQKLTALEWEIMDAVWHLGGSPSVRDVLEHTYDEGAKAYTTVQTVMNNLVDKGFLRKEKIGLVNFYTPLRAREDLVGGETSRFVDRVFEGSFGALAHYLVDADKLSAAEIDALKQLIEARTPPSEEEGL